MFLRYLIKVDKGEILRAYLFVSVVFSFFLNCLYAVKVNNFG